MGARKEKGVIFMVDEKFLAQIDAAYPTLGFGDRATFIRDAVIKELTKFGYHVPAEYRAGPPRTGKGGRPKKYSTEDPHPLPTAKAPPAKKASDSKARKILRGGVIVALAALVLPACNPEPDHRFSLQPSAFSLQPSAFSLQPSAFSLFKKC